MAATGSRGQRGPGPDASGKTGSRSRALPRAAAGVVLLAALTVSSSGTRSASGTAAAGWASVGDDQTTTPIKHVVVLFQENVPFDRYFGVYPHALNPPGEPRFDPRSRHTGRRRADPDTADSGIRTQPPPTGSTGTQTQSLRVQPRLHERSSSAVDKRPAWTASSRRRAITLRLRPDRRDGLLRRQHRDRPCGPTPSTSPSATTRSAPRTDRPTVGLLNLVSGQTHGVQTSQPRPATSWTAA